jgi:hypothetical protein
LRAGNEFLERLAGLIEARVSHRSHLLRNLEMRLPIFTHDGTPVGCFNYADPGANYRAPFSVRLPGGFKVLRGVPRGSAS